MSATRIEPDYEAVVIGAGPGGIAAGVTLQKASITDFVILERADDVGGSWRDNTYPGIAVDVPATSYQFSFARNPNWSRLFPSGAEICTYLQDVARRFGLYDHLRFGVSVQREIWNAEHGFWTLHLDGGDTLTARFLISAVGGYINPKLDTGIPGADDFRGKIIRPVAWDHDYDYRAKRVAVIGTGASSVQIVPSLSPQVDRLDVYQRTPVWCFPKPDVTLAPLAQRVLGIPGVGAAANGALLGALEVVLDTLSYVPARAVIAGMPAFDGAMRAVYRSYLRKAVHDPDTRDALLPTYGALGKRPTLSSSYVRSYNNPTTHLITTPIDRITENGIRTADGTERDVDMLVLATGYELFSDPETYRPDTVVGRDGFDLAKYYAENGLQAYHSVAVPGAPNRWTLVGPYSWSGSGWHSIVEMASRHAVRAIVETRNRDAQVAEVRQEAHDTWHDGVLKRGKAIQHYLVERNAGARTYYVNSQGHSPYIRPQSILKSIWQSNHFPLDDYAYTSVDTRRAS